MQPLTATELLELNQLKLRQTEYIPQHIQILKRFPYIITKNIDIQNGLVNGAPVEIIDLETETNRWNQPRFTLLCKGLEKKIGQDTPITTRIENNRPKNCFPLKQVTVKFTFQEWSVIRTQIPLIPFGAAKFNRGQGKTLDKVAVVTKRMKRDGTVTKVGDGTITHQSFYVGTSRIHDRDRLKIFPCF